MLTDLATAWAIAVALPGGALVAVIAVQKAVGALRRTARVRRAPVTVAATDALG